MRFLELYNKLNNQESEKIYTSELKKILNKPSFGVIDIDEIDDYIKQGYKIPFDMDKLKRDLLNKMMQNNLDVKQKIKNPLK